MTALPDRNGPRPFPMHLMAAMTVLTSSSAVLPILKNASRISNPALRKKAEALESRLKNVPVDALISAVDAEARRRMGTFLEGLNGYRRAEPSPPARDLPALWTDGPARLLDYGADAAPGAEGGPVLVVPSLINRSRILDLLPDNSFLTYLAAAGLRPLLLDWGRPPPDEFGLSLDDYIAGRLVAAAGVAADVAGGPVPAIGYCMGGTLTTALAAIAPDRVSALALLASPWDFHAADRESDIGPPPALVLQRPMLEATISALGYLPVDVIQAMFFSLDPLQGWKKFRKFARMSSGSDAARLFVALEDWLNDGVPLAGPVASACLFDWYLDNTPAAGTWRIGGQAVDPTKIRHPALVVVPSRDRIVPPASAAALAEALLNATRLDPDAGHIGMMIGGNARSLLWDPLIEWLESAA